MVDDNHGLVRIHYLPRVLYVDRGERFFDAIEPFSEGWSIRRHGSNVGDCQKLSATYGNMISFAKKNEQTTRNREYDKPPLDCFGANI